MHRPVPIDRTMPLVGSRGFSLLEALIGVVLLFMLIAGVVTLSRSSINATSRGQDAAGGSSILKDFVDEMRGLNIDSIPRNIETVDTVGEYRITWTVYDQGSPGAYRQPAGLVLLCVRLDYEWVGSPRSVETTTLLGKR